MRRFCSQFTHRYQLVSLSSGSHDILACAVICLTAFPRLLADQALPFASPSSTNARASHHSRLFLVLFCVALLAGCWFVSFCVCWFAVGCFVCLSGLFCVCLCWLFCSVCCLFVGCCCGCLGLLLFLFGCLCCLLFGLSLGVALCVALFCCFGCGLLILVSLGCLAGLQL